MKSWSLSGVDKSFGLPSASPMERMGMIGGIVFIVVLLIVYLLKRSHHENKADRSRNSNLLESFFSEHKFTPEEKDFIHVWIKKYKIEDFLSSVTNYQIFDGCLRKDLEKLADEGNAMNPDLVARLKNIKNKLGFDKLPSGYAMKSTREIELNQSIKIFKKVQGEEISGISKVVRLDDANFIITRPVIKEEKFNIIANDRISASFFRADAEYKFDARVKEVTEDLIKLQHNENIARKQIRGDIRVDVGLPIKYQYISSSVYPAKDGAALDNDETLEGTMADLSRGGARLEVEPTENKEEFIHLWLNLDGLQLDHIRAEIKVKFKKDGRNYVNVEFRNLSEKEQTQIFSYINKMQIWHRGGV